MNKNQGERVEDKSGISTLLIGLLPGAFFTLGLAFHQEIENHVGFSNIAYFLIYFLIIGRLLLSSFIEKRFPKLISYLRSEHTQIIVLVLIASVGGLYFAGAMFSLGK
mgnify:CR=1 FL=1